MGKETAPKEQKGRVCRSPEGPNTPAGASPSAADCYQARRKGRMAARHCSGHLEIPSGHSIFTTVDKRSAKRSVGSEGAQSPSPPLQIYSSGWGGRRSCQGYMASESESRVKAAMRGKSPWTVANHRLGYERGRGPERARCAHAAGLGTGSRLRVGGPIGICRKQTHA